MVRGVLPLMLVSILLLPAAAAADWGVHEASGTEPIGLPGDQPSYWVCAAAVPYQEEVVLRQGDTERIFRPTRESADCRTLPGEPLTVAPSDSMVRVLVLAKTPRDASGPGVFRLVAPGVAVALEDLSEASELGVLRDGDVAVQIVRMDTLAVTDTITEGQETRVDLNEALAATGLLVVLADAPDGASALVEWSDPDWYRRAPTIGHMAVVVAIALFLTLYHGKSPRRVG